MQKNPDERRNVWTDFRVCRQRRELINDHGCAHMWAGCALGGSSCTVPNITAAAASVLRREVPTNVGGVVLSP